MSDSLSSADRDARIAEIERTIEPQITNVDEALAVAWLIAELRASLAREGEARKDAERDEDKLVAVEHALMALEASHGLDLSHCVSYAKQIDAISEQLSANSESIRALAEQVVATDELRAALSREEEAKKDAERMRTMRDDAINIARRMGAAGGVCPTHGISVLVTHTTDGHPCTDYLLAPARSVSLSENG